MIDCPFPARFDEEKREWLLDDGAIEWDEVIDRWRGTWADEPTSTSARCSAAIRPPA